MQLQDAWRREIFLRQKDRLHLEGCEVSAAAVRVVFRLVIGQEQRFAEEGHGGITVVVAVILDLLIERPAFSVVIAVTQGKRGAPAPVVLRIAVHDGRIVVNAPEP